MVITKEANRKANMSCPGLAQEVRNIERAMKRAENKQSFSVCNGKTKKGSCPFSGTIQPHGAKFKYCKRHSEKWAEVEIPDPEERKKALQRLSTQEGKEEKYQRERKESRKQRDTFIEMIEKRAERGLPISDHAGYMYDQFLKANDEDDNDDYDSEEERIRYEQEYGIEEVRKIQAEEAKKRETAILEHLQEKMEEKKKEEEKKNEEKKKLNDKIQENLKDTQEVAESRLRLEMKELKERMIQAKEDDDGEALKEAKLASLSKVLEVFKTIEAFKQKAETGRTWIKDDDGGWSSDIEDEKEEEEEEEDLQEFEEHVEEITSEFTSDSEEHEEVTSEDDLDEFYDAVGYDSDTFNI